MTHQRRFWPNPDQLLLVQCCLERDDAMAREAWTLWKKRVDLDKLDYASFRIMSLAYTRVVSWQLSDPDTGRIKGIYRFQWTKNKLAFRGKADLLRAFAQEGIPTMLLKGAALCQTVYKDPSARPMHDLDLLVPAAEAARVVRLLQTRGWIAQHFAPEEVIKYLHACSFLHPDFGELDLHWHVMRSHCNSTRDAELWAAAVSHTFEGVETKILCPADQFLQACEHGMHHSPSSVLQWLVDACFILRHSGSVFDWERLVAQTQKFELVLPVRETLSYLSRTFREPVPQGVSKALASSPVTVTARVEYFLAGRPESKQDDHLHRAAVAFCHYLRVRQERSARQTILGFPEYLRLITHFPGTISEACIGSAKGAYMQAKRTIWDTRLRLQHRLRGNPPIADRRLGAWPASEMEGFYRVEEIFGQRFRWSAPQASLSLPLLNSRCNLIIEFPGFCFSPRLLERHPVLHFNNHVLTGEHLKWKTHCVVLRVPSAFFREGGRQTISWSLKALSPGGRDERSLGMPVFRILIFPIKSGKLTSSTR